MPGTGLKVCGGGMVCKPILVFSLGQAEQNGYFFSGICNNHSFLCAINHPIQYMFHKFICDL